MDLKTNIKGTVRRSKYDPKGIYSGTFDAVKIRQVCLWFKLER